MSSITIESSDHILMDIDVEVAKCSEFLRKIIEEHDLLHEPIDVVNVPNTTYFILQYVFMWCFEHMNDPQDNETIELSEWDEDFLNIDDDTLWDVMMAAFFFKIRGLFSMTVGLVCHNLGMTPAELRDAIDNNNNVLVEEIE